MDRVRDLVASGSVSVVLAQDRDRFAREPAYHYLLRREFEEYGTKIRALNDRGDDSPEGDLTDGILDQIAKFERAKIAERSRRGKLRKAREGKVLARRRIKYGFKLNAARDSLEVDEEKMATVRRIFHMVGVEGLSQHQVYLALTREGIPTPGGGKHWYRTFFRHCILDDVYKPHTYEEVAELVSPEVAARLDPEKRYGIWWFNRRRKRTRQVSVPTENGGRYKTEQRATPKPKEEWIAVPVPDSGIPREVVDAARDALRDNSAPSSAGRRFWQLSGGIARCGVCTNGMMNRAILANGNPYFYHSCRAHHKLGDTGCTHRKNHPVEGVERDVWQFVSGLLRDPQRLREGLDRMIERERAGMHGDPEQVQKLWLDKLADVERRRSRFQDMAAEELITFDELGAKLGELEEVRRTAERELAALRSSREVIEQLECDRDSLLKHYAKMVPEALDRLTAEERHQVYRMLRLEVYVFPNGYLEIRGMLSEDVLYPDGNISTLTC
jgi:site-specific DNA recombinase